MCRLQLRLGLKVEDLKGSRLCLECNDLLIPVHDSTVRVDRPPYDFIVIFEVDNDNLRFVIFVDFLANADEGIGFESLDGKSAQQLLMSNKALYRLTQLLKPIDAG